MSNNILIYPSYLPSIASMVAIAKATSITLEVADNYQKQTYRNRAYIAHSNGSLLLNIPIKHAKEIAHQKTKNVVPENNFKWLKEHWRSIQTAYRTSPYFEYYEEDLAPLYSKPVPLLLDFNIKILETFMDLIGIEKPLTQTQTYSKEITSVDKRNLVVCKKEKVYNFKPYHQVFEVNHGFIENLSVLDLLCNEGPNTLQYLENQEL